MIDKNFRLNILFRVLIIVALAIALAFVLTRQPSLFVPVVIVLALIVTIVSLIVYIERSNKDLTRFLLSIRQGAFTESLPSGNRGKPFEEFSDAMNDILREFAKLNEEKELHYQYLETLNEKINVAILSFDTDGKLLTMNPAAKQLINLPSFAAMEDFRKLDVHLAEVVENIKPEERAVLKAYFNNEQFQIAVQRKEIVLKEKPVTIILLQNLNNELESKEIEAWHQLMRVLTHEIMNSVTPIVSLTSAIQSILAGNQKDIRSLKDENIDDILSSLETIHSRSNGLLKFVNSYREYSKSIELKAENTDVEKLVARVVDLLLRDLEKLNIRLQVKKNNTSLIARTDAMLMEQVIINLLKNAMEAVPHDGSGMIIILLEKTTGNSVRVSITDNGSGIDTETLHKIFIPFFTTKSKGSGIGLSFSRQILKLHNGNIRVTSAPGKGSTFIIEWK